ncbi:Protein tssc1, partial [Nowakowskiella sp. JEL0078]
ARCIAAQSEEERNRFLVGTCSVKNDNELYLLDFDEDEFEITGHSFKHPKEILSISPCYKKSDLLFTTHSEVVGEKLVKVASLWMMGALEIEESGRLKNHHGTLQELLVLKSETSNLNKVIWNPSGVLSNVIALSERDILIFDIDGSLVNAKMINSIPVIENKNDVITCGTWNPHSSNEVIVGFGTTVSCWDMRSKNQKFSIPKAHTMTVRDLDFNPNKPHHLATCGDDRYVRFWDARNLEEPLKELVLSAGSDGRVNLQSIISISSAPLVDDDEDPDELESSNGKPHDCLVNSFDEHENSIYSVVWSYADPWIFASVSFDGRVLVNLVPREHKYKILL